MKKGIFITTAIIALVLSLFRLITGFYLLLILHFFFVQMIIEGGIYKEISINGQISYCIQNLSCIRQFLFSGLISVYTIIAFIIPIGSFFSIKGMNSEEIYYKKRNILFLIINIITIILVGISFVMWGVIPRI